MDKEKVIREIYKKVFEQETPENQKIILEFQLKVSSCIIGHDLVNDIIKNHFNKEECDLNENYK